VPSNLPPPFCPDPQTGVKSAAKKTTNAIAPNAFKNMFLILFLLSFWSYVSGRDVICGFRQTSVLQRMSAIITETKYAQLSGFLKVL
jgi:hypothetical protein